MAWKEVRSELRLVVGLGPMASRSCPGTATVAGIGVALLIWRLRTQNRTNKYASAENKRHRVGEYCLCVQRGGRMHRSDDVTLRMSFADATVECNERNRGRKKGNKLCVCPVDIAEEWVPQASLITVQAVAKMARGSSGNYLNLRKQRFGDCDIASVLSWCRQSDPDGHFTHMGLTDSSASLGLW